MGVLMSQFGGIFSDIWNAITSVFDAIGIVIGNIFEMVFEPIWKSLYYLFLGICQIANICEVIFRKMAGLGDVWINGVQIQGATHNNPVGGGIVMGFLTEDAVWRTFVAIIVLSVILLFVFTIIALIKAEFALDSKASAKGPIFQRAFKSLVMFLLVPALCVAGIYGVNLITLVSQELLSGSSAGTSIVQQCFKAGAYGANRARSSVDAPESMSFLHFVSGVDGGANYGLFRDADGNDKISADADKIDKAFVAGGTPEIPFMPYIRVGGNTKNDGILASATGGFGAVIDLVTAWDEGGAANSHMIMQVYGKGGSTLSIYNYFQVRYFYNMADFDYIIGIGSALCMSWILLSTCITLIKRVFEIVMLMLLAPPMIAMAPLDNGQAQKKWQGEMIKRIIAVIGPVFAFNMYFLITPIFSRLTLFGSIQTEAALSTGIGLGVAGSQAGVFPLAAVGASAVIAYDIMFQLIVLIVGLSIVKQASALISSLLGIEDLVKGGLEASKKAVATGAQLATVAFGGAGLAVKGAAAAFKAGKAVVGKAKGAASKAINKKRMDKAAKLDNEANSSEASMNDAMNRFGDADDPEIREEIDKKREKAKFLRDKVGLSEAKASGDKDKVKEYKDAIGDDKLQRDKRTKFGRFKIGVKQKAAAAGEGISKVAGGVADSVGDLASAVAESKFGQRVGAIGKGIGKGVGAVGKGIGKAGGWAGKKIGDGAKAVKESWQEAADQQFSAEAIEQGLSVFAGGPEGLDRAGKGVKSGYFRMIVDPLTGLMGGKEDGPGLLLRRAWDKEERKRYLYTGKEHKELELNREQGLMMDVRDKATEKIEERKEKDKEKKVFQEFLKQNRLGKEFGKQAAEAYAAAMKQFNSSKDGKADDITVNGNKKFGEFKAKLEEDAKLKAETDAVESKKEQMKVDSMAVAQMKSEETKTAGQQRLELGSNTIEKLQEIFKKAQAEGNEKVAKAVANAIQAKQQGNQPAANDLAVINKYLERIAANTEKLK